MIVYQMVPTVIWIPLGYSVNISEQYCKTIILTATRKVSWKSGKLAVANLIKKKTSISTCVKMTRWKKNHFIAFVRIVRCDSTAILSNAHDHKQYRFVNCDFFNLYIVIIFAWAFRCQSRTQWYYHVLRYNNYGCASYGGDGKCLAKIGIWTWYVFDEGIHVIRDIVINFSVVNK